MRPMLCDRIAIGVACVSAAYIGVTLRGRTPASVTLELSFDERTVTAEAEVGGHGWMGKEIPLWTWQEGRTARVFGVHTEPRR